jgi:hypothetical protein
MHILFIIQQLQTWRQCESFSLRPTNLTHSVSVTCLRWIGRCECVFEFHLGHRYLGWVCAYSVLMLSCRSRDSVVGIATSYGLDVWEVGVRVPVGSRMFLFSRSSRPALRSTQPPLQWVPGDLSPEVKRPGREVDHSPPNSAEVKKMWIYTSAPPYAFMA